MSHPIPRRFSARAALPALCLLLLASPAAAVRQLPANLEQMAQRAERIVVAVCSDRRDGEALVEGHALGYTEFTFQVSEVLKGSVGPTLHLRQVDLGRRSGLRGHNPVPLPEYAPGEEVLLFLAGDSVLGFASPVGLDQGVFDVRTEAGERVLRRRAAGGVLFRGMAPERMAAARSLAPAERALLEAPPSEGLPYEAFVSLVRKLGQGR